MSWNPLLRSRRGVLASDLNTGVALAGLCLCLTPLQATPLTLSKPEATASGRLRLQVQGDPGATLVVELAPDLTSWVPVDTLVLSSGTTNLFLPTSGSQLFCRVRTAAPVEIPNPLSFTPVPNPDFVRTQFVFDTPVTLALTDDDGVAYEVAATDYALSDPTTVRMQVVNQARSLPPGFRYITGVELAPHAITALGDVHLTFSLPAGTDVSQLAVVHWSEGGSELHLVPFNQTNGRIELALHVLGGYGLVALNGGDLAAWRQTIPTDEAARTVHEIALNSAPFDAVNQAASASDGNVRHRAGLMGPMPCDRFQFWLGKFQQRRDLLRLAVYNDWFLETALDMFNSVSGFEDLLTEPCFDAIEVVMNDCDRLAIQALANSVEREARLCRFNKDLRAVVRLYRDIRLAKHGHWTARMPPGLIDQFMATFHDCLQFDVELLSTTQTQSRGGTVRTSMSAKVPIEFGPYQDPVSGKNLLRIFGQDTASVDSTVWENLKAPCVASPNPADGVMAVFALNLRGIATDIRTIIHSDEDLDLPTLELMYDPFRVPLSERYLLTCPPAVGFVIESSFWGAAFGGLHLPELIRVEGAKQSFLAKGFRQQFPSQPYRLDYQREGSVDGLHATENTSILVTYKGSGP